MSTGSSDEPSRRSQGVRRRLHSDPGDKRHDARVVNARGLAPSAGRVRVLSRYRGVIALRWFGIGIPLLSALTTAHPPWLLGSIGVAVVASAYNLSAMAGGGRALRPGGVCLVRRSGAARARPRRLGPGAGHALARCPPPGGFRVAALPPPPLPERAGGPTGSDPPRRVAAAR